MELVTADVKGVSHRELGWDEVLIFPIADAQVGADGSAQERLKRWVDYALRFRNSYFIGLGDYVDVASPSNRQRVRNAELYDTVMQALHEKGEEHIYQFLKCVDGSQGRWLGMLEGHHFWDFEDGTTSDTRICEKLNAPFLGTCAVVRLSFLRPKTASRIRRSRPVTIWCHHGTGGGVKASAPLNKLENIADSFDADIYLMAHQHKLVATRKPQLYMSQRAPYRVKERERVLVSVGSWLRAYQASSKQPGGRAGGTYVEKRMMPPVAVGGCIVKVRPLHREDEDRIQIRVEV